MKWIRRAFGLDGFDLTVHVGVTILLMMIGGTIWSHDDAIVMLATVGGASLVLLAVRRRQALAHQPPEALPAADTERLAELEVRMDELERAQDRILELEERLDFAERLLARAREPERLP